MSALKTWNVRIEFTDGVWERQAISASKEQAEHLVMLDARMMTADHPCFFGKVLSITSTEAA